MTCRIALLLALATALPAFPPATAAVPTDPVASTPERVVSMRMRNLPPERYRELRDQWRAYTAAHPRDPLGWSQSARAAHYAGTPCGECVEYARKAVRLAPGDPEALATLGRLQWDTYCPGQPKDPGGAIALLERALRLDPRLDDPRYILWFMRMSQGRRDLAEEQLRILLDTRRIPEPLVDFGYNLLAGLEPDAILITNGDNDTYPLLALQAARGLRTDVTVVNLNCSELLWYRRQLRESTPGAPVPLLEGAREGRLASAVVKGLVEELAKSGWKRPLYLAVTVPCEPEMIPNTRSLEGLVYRVRPETGGGLTVDRALIERNLDRVYRLQSATSVAVDWNEWSALRQLSANYTATGWQLANRLLKDGETTAARERLVTALTLLEFHRLRKEGAGLVDAWSALDPGWPGLAHWRRTFQP